ncbi:uracil-DNA glycosylase [Heliorestis acidaminivorans]|uniref:Uracil-DNA glycosylase n=1 Tax=Heliorestis acidaminivorans TaxID=553427 RepID=A0A6I0F016_9FIRM|nr:uracil-DNA glycosylase [Heliorestis acidaminivorans]KAB2952312.1 uracil-DNA glycosylase [Heliorestis acidaminivorans]
MSNKDKNVTISEKQRINCLRCEHFYITWEPKFPRGCKLLNFKTRSMPSLVVFQSCGHPCDGFREKKKL